MDGSSTRRGARTAHLHHGDLHGTESWRGEARRFGEGVAILIGDLAHVYADQLLPPSPPTMLPVWDVLRIELQVGQYLALLGTPRAATQYTEARLIPPYM